MNLSCQRILATATLLSITAGAAAQPAITSLNDTDFARSQRVAITGTGFGTGGDVVIGGVSAWTSTWTDTRIVAYVPETATLGAAVLNVVVSDQPSNDVALVVTDRQTSGRVKWIFETDATNVWWRPALAPDGTIYIHTNNITDGVIYALTPDGALKWIQKINWFPYGPPSAGPDGAVYVGSIASAFRISASGELDWEFQSFGGDGIHSIPTVGPDGMLYGAYDAGIGAFSLDPANGALDWSNSGDPFMYDWLGNHGHDIVFGRGGAGQPLDRFYIAQEGDSDLFAYTLDGDQIFSRGLSNGGTPPAIGSDGTVYSTAFLSRYVMALDPDDGSELWLFNSGVSSEAKGVEIGPDDTLYVNFSGHLHSLDPQTGEELWRNFTGVILNRLSLTPDGTTLVTSGIPNYGQPGFIRAYSAADGAERWNIDLPGTVSPGFRVLGTHHPRITSDSATAYVPTYTVADGSNPPDPKAYLYAIDMRPDITARPADMDGDGTVGFADLSALLAAWGPCPGGCEGACPADIDGDCAVGFEDLTGLLSDWG